MKNFFMDIPHLFQNLRPNVNTNVIGGRPECKHYVREKTLCGVFMIVQDVVVRDMKNAGSFPAQIKTGLIGPIEFTGLPEKIDGCGVFMIVWAGRLNELMQTLCTEEAALRRISVHNVCIRPIKHAG